jgi:hypothetical protein
MKKVAGNYANENLDERDRDSDPDRNQTRDQRERHPNCSDEPNILKDDVRHAETEPNLIKHRKLLSAHLLRTQESLALKQSAQFSRNWEGKLHCPAVFKLKSRLPQGAVFGFRRNFKPLRSTS